MSILMKTLEKFLIKVYNYNACDGSLAKLVRQLTATQWPLVQIRQEPPLALVAQLDRVLGYEPRGCGFDFCLARHNNY